MAAVTNSQLIFVVDGNDTNGDGGIDYANSGGTTATSFAPDEPFATNPGFQDPYQVVADTAAGLYFVIDPNFTGNGTGGGKVLEGNLADPTQAATVAYTVPIVTTPPDQFAEAWALAIDTTNHVVYVAEDTFNSSDSDFGAHSGIVKFSYNPLTGAVTAATDVFVRPTGANNEILSLSLDSANQKLYFVDDSEGSFGSAPSVTNEVEVLDLNTNAVTTLVTLPSGANYIDDTGTHDYTQGGIAAVAVDTTDHLVFFTTGTGFNNAADEAVNSIYVIDDHTAGQTPVKLTESASFDLLDPEFISFDSAHGKLWVSYINEDASNGAGDLGHLVRYDVTVPTPGSPTGVTLSNPVDFTLPLAEATADLTAGTFPEGSFLDDLPVLTTSGTATHAVEQSANVTLLTGAPTITDSDGDHLASATVQITAGTFSANENSTADDHLTIDSAHRTGTDTSGTINGTSISYSYDSATEKLTLTGYDTLTDYQTALSYVQYFTTDNNPTDYGADNTRTITWQVNDGAVGNPSGTNTTTTTLTIDAVNDSPTLFVNGGGDSALISVNETNSGINQSHTLTINDPDSLTETLSISNFSHTGPTGGLSDPTLEGYFSIPPAVNITQATGSTNFIWTFDSGAEAFDYLAAGQQLVLDYTIKSLDSNDSNAPVSTSLFDLKVVEVTITGTNDAPVVTAGNTLSYTENDPATTISPTATVADVDSADFNGGSLTVAFTANGTAADQLTIANQGVGAGEIGVSGNTITYGGLTIGTFTGGTNGTNLVVTFTTADATPAAAQALLDDIQYANSSDNPSTAARTVTYTVVDGDGTANSGTDTGTATATINVIAVNDAPVATITPTEYDGSPNVAINLKNNGLSVSDVDGGAGSETVTLSVTPNGTLTVTAGTSGAIVSNSGTSSVTITGTTAQIDDLLNTNATSTVSFIDATGGIKTLTLAIDDNGNTGGGDLTAQDTAQIILDAPPVVANAGNTVSYTEQQTSPTAIFVDSAITVTDSDSANLSGATVKITSGLVAGDVLAAVTTGNITAVWNGTDTLTLSGADTKANYQQVLESVTYTTPSDDPTNGGADLSRTITWTATDDLGASSAPGTTTTINITAINDAPTATITPASYSATEQVSLNLKNNGLAVSDPDGNAAGVSETVTLSVASEGILNVTAGTSGAAVSNSGTSSVTITGTAAQIDALLTSDGTSTVSYIDNSDTPVPSVTLTLAINDNGFTGGGNLTSSDTATINITAVNDAPVLTGFGDTPSFTENGSSVVLDVNHNASVSDAELDVSPNHYAGATLTIARDGGPNSDDSFVGTGTLDLSDAGPGGNVSLDGGTTFIGTFVDNGDGSVQFTFNANATAANIDSVMRQIAYANSSDNPPATVQIDFTFSDGNGQPGGQAQGAAGPAPGIAVGTFTVNVTQVDDAPVLLNVAPVAGYTPGSPGVVLSSGLQAFDVDATPPSPNVGWASATVTIATGFLAGDQLFVNLPTSGGHFITPDTGTSNISVQSNAGGVLVLSGTDSVLAYQEVLDAVSYMSIAADPSNGGADPTRNITWQVNDGVLNSQTPSTDPNNPVNDTLLHFAAAPVVDLDTGAAGDNSITSFTENGAPIPIGNAISVTDSDDATLSSATIVLTNAKPGDALSIVGALPAGISSSIDTSVAGQITINLSGQVPVADYQTAIGQIRFVNTSDNPDPTDRVITVQVANEDESNVAQATVHVIPVNDPPVLSNVAASASVAFAGQTVTVSSGLTVSDVDNVTLAGATVAITAGTFAGDGDVLAANTSGTSITASYNAATETLALSGTDTLAHYQQVLDSVTFHSTSANPTNSGADPTRTVTWQVNDGSALNNLSATAITTINVRPNPTNDFNGDGISDLLFQNIALGNSSVMIDLLNGTNVISSATIADSSGLKVEATGDFNHDGKADIVFQRPDGTPEIWLMNGTSVTGKVTLPNPGTDWHIIATGDFNADGNTDILWQNNNGWPAIWLMDGTTVEWGNALPNPGTFWHVIGTGDFNGDGKADILWQGADGTPAIWLMDGSSIAAWGNPLPNPGTSWHVIGTGDFNGDGKSDILWQNNDGTPAIWFMNGSTIAQWGGPIPNPGPTWQLKDDGPIAFDATMGSAAGNAPGTAAITQNGGPSGVASFTTPPSGTAPSTVPSGAASFTPTSTNQTAALFYSAPDAVGSNMHLSAPDSLVDSSVLTGNGSDLAPKTLAHS